MAERVLPMEIRETTARIPSRSAEPKLQEAIGKGGILIVNNALLVMLNEAPLVGLAFRTAPARSGTVTTGLWYRPLHAGVVAEIEDEFVHGEPEIVFEEVSRWEQQRPLRRVITRSTGGVLLPSEQMAAVVEAATILATQGRTTTQEEREAFLRGKV